MTTDNQSETDTEGTETEDLEQENQQDESTDETSGQEESLDESTDSEQDGETEDEAPKPDPAKQALLADLSKARGRAKAAEDKLAALEATVSELTTKAEQADSLQARYDRLEAFAQEVGLGRALDSKSFTTKLFETDQKISDIVKEWHQANPSETRNALGAGGGEGGGGKPDINALLRKAAQ